jgi:hypothetical protein
MVADFMPRPYWSETATCAGAPVATLKTLSAPALVPHGESVASHQARRMSERAPSGRVSETMRPKLSWVQVVVALGVRRGSDRS